MIFTLFLILKYIGNRFKDNQKRQSLKILYISLSFIPHLPLPLTCYWHRLQKSHKGGGRKYMC